MKPPLNHKEPIQKAIENQSTHTNLDTIEIQFHELIKLKGTILLHIKTTLTSSLEKWGYNMSVFANNPILHIFEYFENFL